MRMLFMGTAEFAVPSLISLLQAGHDVTGVVTQPDKPVGRKKILQASPVKQYALEHGLPVYQPERLRRDKSFLDQVRGMELDVVTYAAYGQILPPSFLEIPRLGCWNVHGSLLPRYRGAAPIQWAIVNGERETGVCVMIAEAGLDTGPVLAEQALSISEEDTALTLGARMAEIGAELLIDTLAAWEKGEVNPKVQDNAAATYAPSIQRDDARIQWQRPARDIHNLIRGMHPRPGAWTTFRGQEFKVLPSRLGNSGTPLSAGAVHVVNGAVMVGTGEGVLELLEVQPAGKRAMPAVEWARGIRKEDRFE